VLLSRLVATGYGSVCGWVLLCSSSKTPHRPKTTCKGCVFKARRGQPASKIGNLN
jgi:hypothetical protein